MKAIVVDKNYGSLHEEDYEIIRKSYEKAGIQFEMKDLKTDDEIIESCQDADVLLCTGNPPITGKVFKNCKNLKLVQRFGIGVNSVDLDAATETNKVALFMPGFCVNELAAHATSFIMALNRNTAYYDRKIRQGEWPKGQYYQPKDMSKLILGLYGFGGSAKPLYHIFHFGFGTKVITCDPYVPEEVRKQYEVEFVTFDEMLERSDIISIHAPLNDETRHIFNKKAFRKMKKDSMIINIARGPLIDQEALIWALKNEEIRFAGLDVFETEPLAADSELRKMDNVMLSCHSAFYGVGSKKRQIELAIELVERALLEKKIESRYVANRAVIKTNKEYQFD